MRVKDFDYHLPDELIARYPADERDASRLMLLDRSQATIGEDVFCHIGEHLHPGDLLVMNDTRVIPARIMGRKETGGRVEIFLLERLGGAAERWRCMLRGSKRFRDGQKVLLAGGMHAIVCSRQDEQVSVVEFYGALPFEAWLEQEGRMPLPPYLGRDADESDRERYQTVVAQTPGAVAAPTAGLHFTETLLAGLMERGISTVCLTLHTGLGTFLPVRTEHVADHRIHQERYYIPPGTAEAVVATRARGGRVVAVGTTVARTLEHAADDKGRVAAGDGLADIFIYPGYVFKVVDALVTNFHLPESTLLMLVSAFAGTVFTRHAYEEAVSRKFRFYSYGDAMLIQ